MSKFIEKSNEELFKVFKEQEDFPTFDANKPWLFYIFEVRINSEGGKGFSIKSISYPKDILDGSLERDYTFLGVTKSKPRFPWFVNNKILEEYPDIVDFKKTIDEIFNKVVPK